MIRKIFAFVSMLGCCQLAAQPIPINPSTTTYDYYPSTAAGTNHSTWVAWHAYKNSNDSIAARRVEADGSLGARLKVSEAGSVHGPPRVVTLPNETAEFVWSSFVEQRWRINMRRRSKGDLGEIVQVSSFEHDAVYPDVIVLDNDRLFVVWSENRGNRFQVRGRIISTNGQLAPVAISSEKVDAYRPSLAIYNGQAWAVWDQHADHNYSVRARPVWPTLGAEEMVSPPNEHC